PAAAGIPDRLFLLTPPQAGFVMQAPNGLIDLAQPPEPRGAAHAPGARSVGRLATASVTEAKAVLGWPGEEVGTKAGVVTRVRNGFRFAQAIGTDRNTDLNERHQ
ncbi:MAG: hypothetical protein ACKO3C_10475, partial [Betaproteobacteria bacterium]